MALVVRREGAAVTSLPDVTGQPPGPTGRLAALPAGEFRWHYGPTETDPYPGSMWHYDCGLEVMTFEGAYICGCGAYYDPDDDAPEGDGQ